MKFKTVISVSAWAAAGVSLTVACAKPDNKASVARQQKPATEQQKAETIQAGLSKLTGGKYNPNLAENMKMAARLEAASATVQKLQAKDDKTPVWGVRVRFLLKDLPEIAAQKELSQFQDLETLENDDGIPSNYMIEAVCGGADCDRVTAILSEKSDTNGATPVSRLAVIFTREKTLAEQKRIAEKSRQAKANGKGSRDDKSAVLEFDETKPAILKVFWSASPDSSKFMSGGSKKTIEELEGSTLLKAHQAAKWPDVHKVETQVVVSSGADPKTGGAADAVPLTIEDLSGATRGAGADGDRGGSQEETQSEPLPGSAPLGQGGIGHSF